jgi:spermidine synthase
VRIVVGDGRRSLARSDERYDLLVIDAFSSDAIPVHLLTVEAVRTYLEHLADDGILAIHVSNRYLELEPVVGAIAKELGTSARTGRFVETAEQAENGILGSDWVVLAKDPELIERLPRSLWSTTKIRSKVRAWTDDRADLLGVLVR